MFYKVKMRLTREQHETLLRVLYAEMHRMLLNRDERARDLFEIFVAVIG